MKSLKNAPVRQSQAGFTLIELIMVIVILGILSAVAAPKFLDLTGDAENAASASIHGTMQSTMAVAFAKHRSSGSNGDGSLDTTDSGLDTYITTCATLIAYLDGGLPANTTCTGSQVTFPNGQVADITGEDVDSRASLSALADAS